MAELLERGPEELQRWVDDLGRRLVDPSIHHLSPPLAAARLDRPAQAFTDLVARRSPPRDDADVLALFALARAGIRIAHVVTSPWCFAFARDVSRRARWAARWQASRRPIVASEMARIRADFSVLSRTLLDASEGFSIHEIVETHVIVEGLAASMARPAPSALYQLAAELYRESPGSLRLLSRLADRFGIESGVTLAPRLCAAALKFPFPAIALGDLLHSLDQHSDRIADLLAMSAERFFAACRLDPESAARSSREFSTDAPFLEADAWGDAIRSYFERYEAIDTIEDRLQAAIHPMRSAPADSTTDARPVFQPTWAIYAGGPAADLRPVPGTLTGFARWVADALDLLDGLAWLNQPDSAAG